MNDEAKIRTIIAAECELESMADDILATLAFEGYRIVPTPLEDWRRTQVKPLPVPPGFVPVCNWGPSGDGAPAPDDPYWIEHEPDYSGDKS